jgi:hypothetical protein
MFTQRTFNTLGIEHYKHSTSSLSSPPEKNRLPPFQGKLALGRLQQLDAAVEPCDLRPVAIRAENRVDLGVQICRREDQRVRHRQGTTLAPYLRRTCGDTAIYREKVPHQSVEEPCHPLPGVMTERGPRHHLGIADDGRRQRVSSRELAQLCHRDIVERIVGIEEADDDRRVEQDQSHSPRSPRTARPSSPPLLKQPAYSSRRSSTRAIKTRPRPCALTCTTSPSRNPASLNAPIGMVIWCLLDTRERLRAWGGAPPSFFTFVAMRKE